MKVGKYKISNIQSDIRVSDSDSSASAKCSFTMHYRKIEIEVKLDLGNHANFSYFDIVNIDINNASETYIKKTLFEVEHHANCALRQAMYEVWQEQIISRAMNSDFDN